MLQSGDPKSHAHRTKSDGQLWHSYVDQDDEGAFDELMVRYAPAVLRRCRRVLAREHDAEDACQVTFQLFHEKAASLDDPEAVGGWLMGAAYRIAVRMRQRVSRRARFEVDAPDEIGIGVSRADDQDLREAAHILMSEVGRLPDDYRLVVSLCYVEGLTHPEAAGRLGWPLGTVKSNLVRAKRMLRERPACRRLMV